MATVNCPACGRSLEVEDAYRDWTVRCPHCDGEFVPDEAESPPEERPRRRRRSREDDEYDDDRDDRRAYAREDALQLVSAPAVWLEICGWMSALGSIGLFALGVVLAAEIANNPPAKANPNDDPAEMFAVLGCCAGVFGVPYGIVMAIGARRMRNLSSRGWALTSAILGIAAFILFGVLGLIQAGVGIWAIVTLEKPEVREVFGARRRYRRGRDWDD